MTSFIGYRPPRAGERTDIDCTFRIARNAPIIQSPRVTHAVARAAPRCLPMPNRESPPEYVSYLGSRSGSQSRRHGYSPRRCTAGALAHKSTRCADVRAWKSRRLATTKRSSRGRDSGCQPRWRCTSTVNDRASWAILSEQSIFVLLNRAESVISHSLHGME